METRKILIIVGLLFLGLVAFLWLRPDDNERKISQIPTRDTEGEIRIIAFGDSLTAGYNLPAQEAYPAKLEAALKAENKSVEVINAGVSGETTRGSLERAEFIRQQNPDIVLLGIGGNDALRQLSIADAKSNIAKTVKILKSGDNPPVVVLLQMQAPINAGLAYKKEFDLMYETLSEEQNVLLAPFLTLEVFLTPENKLPDGIHLNARGYETVVEDYLMPVILPIIEQLEE